MLSMKQFQAAMYSSAIMAAASVIFSPSISHANSIVEAMSCAFLNYRDVEQIWSWCIHPDLHNLRDILESGILLQG